MTLLDIFDTAQNRAEKTIKPANGWFECLPNKFQYRFRLDNYTDVTSFQKYYHEGKYVAALFDFNEEELNQVRQHVGINFEMANGFYIEPNATIFPHIDYSPKRSQKTTILNLTGTGSVLRLYSNFGDIILELPEMVERYTLFPKAVIHSYTVGNEAAKLINIWHD